MREIKTEDRPTCSCGRKMTIVEYSSYYETFNYFDCGYCEVDPDDYKADDYTRVLMPSESEETEMKKDIEWAIKEIKGLETEPSQNYPHDEMIEREMVLGILSQLDEPEVLSQELPVIPKFAADWIESSRKAEYHLLGAVYDGAYSEDMKEWLFKGDKRTRQDNQDKLTRAWLDGFTAEEEQKYYALIKGHENIGSDDKYWNYCITDESLFIDDNKVHPDVLGEYVLSATKGRWKNLGVNDDNADFVLVEEME